MKCKACGNDVSIGQKKALDPANQDDIEVGEWEDLCFSCLTVAKDCYNGYTVEAGMRDFLLEKYCRHPDFYEFETDLDVLFANAKGDSAICNVGSE